MLQFVIVSICHFGLVLVRSHPGATGAEWKIFSVSVPHYHCNIICMSITMSLLLFLNHIPSQNWIHGHVVSYTMRHMCCMNEMLCYDYPHWGASRGGCNENAFSQCYTSFHAIPQGKWGAGETVGRGCRRESGILCRHKCFGKYLGYLHNQASSEYVVRRFRGTRNKIPLVPWSREDPGKIHYFIYCFKNKTWRFFEITLVSNLLR